MGRVGIIGGTFDPIHLGHLIIAETAVDFLRLDELLFMPTFITPHKSEQNITFAEHRFKMVELAIKGNNKFKVSRIELDRQGKSYTIDTLRAVQQEYQTNAKELYLVIGGDSYRDFASWYQPDEILKLCSLVVAARPECDVEKDKPAFIKSAIHLPTPLLEISSTKIRENLNASKSVRYQVPNSVLEYIGKHSLYVS